MIDLTLAQEIYSVSQLNSEIRDLLENNFPLVWVEGEISNFKRPASGHMYFSLKDAQAQVRCAMFRQRNSLLTFEPKDGTHVLVQARISLYEERGDYQLIIEHIEETGDGKLRRAFEQLKQRLAQEGLFEAKFKKAIPSLPASIGVITSATGAAIRDIINVLKRRCSWTPIIIYPTAVQGADAAKQIVAALELANQRKECDVLILARGGGSLEDLWPFNEEIVARAIFCSAIPIISGVGHEIDFTIADFVADQRAPTPSAAAELVSPNMQEFSQKVNQFYTRLKQVIFSELKYFSYELKNLIQRLQHPGQKLQEQTQRLDYLEIRLQSALQHQLKNYQQQFVMISRALNAISPLNTLERGYAIVSKDEKILQDLKHIKINDKITARLKQGSLDCVVTKITL